MADIFGILKGYTQDLDEWLTDTGTKKLLKRGLAAYDEVSKNEEKRAQAIIKAGNQGGARGTNSASPVSQSQAIESENPLAHEAAWRGRLATYLAAASGTEVRSAAAEGAPSMRSIALNFKG